MTRDQSPRIARIKAGFGSDPLHPRGFICVIRVPFDALSERNADDAGSKLADENRISRYRDKDRRRVVKHGELTERVIAAFYHVYNVLGWGFLEKVYHNALAHELRKRGLSVVSNQKIDVFYEGVHVGEYFADLVVEGIVIVELKAVEHLLEEHEAQLLNYLRPRSSTWGCF
jgi:GxxExxY protein